MSLRVRNRNESPPGYWRFPVNGKIIGPFPARSELINAVRKAHSVNDKLSPVDLETAIDDWICKQIDPSLCEDAETGSKLLVKPTGKSLVVQFNAVVQGTLTMGEWFVKGRLMKKMSLVDQSAAVARGTICTSCEHNVPVGRCAPCVAGRMLKAVERIVGNASTPIDGQLNACNLCGCALKSKVWMPLELLKKHMAEDHLSQFPDYCWLKKEES